MIDLENYGGEDRTFGTFPNVTAVNSSGGNNDGTPFMAAMVDEVWGFYQACMYQVGYTPSGNTENYLESQMLEALKNICGGPGELVLYGGNNTMLGLSDKRLLPLTGAIYLVADYQELIDEVWDSSENSTTEGFYRSSDGLGITRDVSGNYFHVPDYRGLFIRGYDPVTIHDPDERIIHSIQYDRLKEHEHYIQSPLLSSSFYGKSFSNLSASGSDKFLGFFDSSSDRAEAGKSPPGQTAEETRPKNRNALICVRY